MKYYENPLRLSRVRSNNSVKRFKLYKPEFHRTVDIKELVDQRKRWIEIRFKEAKSITECSQMVLQMTKNFAPLSDLFISRDLYDNELEYARDDICVTVGGSMTEEVYERWMKYFGVKHHGKK